jgi:hypothetical protein
MLEKSVLKKQKQLFAFIYELQNTKTYFYFFYTFTKYLQTTMTRKELSEMQK